jgi:hypothetical protein
MPISRQGLKIGQRCRSAPFKYHAAKSLAEFKVATSQLIRKLTKSLSVSARQQGAALARHRESPSKT